MKTPAAGLLLLTLASVTCRVCAAGTTDTGCRDTFKPAPGSYRFVEAPERAIEVPADATIDNIHITRLEVFDESNPRENNAVYRFGNRFHVLTRERTVARDLLFESGDPYDERVIEESARLLRDRDHLYDADVRPVSVCGDKVDVEVITRDVWSFTPEVSFSRSGGENTFRAGIAETNLLGLGRELSFTLDNDIDRDSSRFSYEDANVGGSRVDLKLEYTDSDDGFQQFGRVGVPFYALDTRRAWRISYDKLRRDEEQYFRGDAVTSINREIEEFSASAGFSRGVTGDVVRRWRFGWNWRDEQFRPSLDLPPPDQMPAARTLSFPWVEFQSIEDNYTTSFNLDEIHRTEDLHIGHSLTLRLGYSADAFGADEDRLVTRLDYADTLMFDDKHLLQHFASVDAFYNFDQRASEDLVAHYTMRYFRSRNTRRSFFATFSAAYIRNLNSQQQVVFGGLTGARAFDNRFQVGDRRINLSIEERQYTNLHILNLVRVGYAAFLDVGRAWAPGVDDGIDEDWLADVGLGIRLASSKADVGRIIHIDFAVPLTNRDDPGVDSLQVSINIKQSF